MKTVGIIGGLGPETTAEFYLELITRSQKLNKVQRPSIFICSIPLPLAIEEDAILRGLGEERYVPFLIEAAQKLEKAGADFLVMPCNTLHIFIKDIRDSVGIPMLSIAEEAVRFLKERNILSVGMLSTDITLKKKVYEDFLLGSDIVQVLPDSFQQKKIGKIIYRLVMNNHGDEDKKELAEIISDFVEKGVKDVLLACTDLQIITPQYAGINIHDTMKILADATTREMLKD